MNATQHRTRAFCPVCGALGGMFDRRRLAKGVHQNFCCAGCGMVWTFPQRSREEYWTFYRGDYTAKVYGLDTPEKNKEVLAWRTRRSLEKIVRAQGFWKRGMSVLEIGAGTGAFLAALRKRYGCRAWGIEPAASFVTLAEKMLRIKMFQGTFEQWMKKRPAKFPRKYDRVVLDQVLEHVLDPLGFLRRLLPFLTARGALFISVPNIAEPKDPREKFFIFEHVSSFSPFPLALLLLRAGYKVTGLYPERPGSLQITAEPIGSATPSVPWEEIGGPVSEEEIMRRFDALE